MSNAEENIELVRGFLAAINEWDFEGMRERLHPEDFVFRLPYGPDWIPTEIAGRDAYVGFAAEWSEAIDGTENLHDIEIDTLARDPDTVIATFKNEMPIKASGYLYKNDLIGILKIANGLIVCFEERLNAIPLTIAAGGRIEPPTAS